MPDINDEIFEDLITRQLQSLRFDAGLRKQVLADLVKLEKELVNKIRVSGLEGTSVKQKRINALLKSTRVLIAKDFKNIDAKNEKVLTGFAKLEADKTTKIFNTVLAVDTVSVTASRIKSIYSTALIEGAQSSEWWLRQSEKTTRAFADNMREGLLRGETNQQLVQRVRGTRAFGFSDGLMNTTRRDADALVRTSVQAVANESRFQAMEVNREFIKQYQHVSTLDSRTSDVCIVRDGLRWNAETKAPIGHNIPFRVPPIHWSCRSTLIAILKGAGIPDDATRASIDGPVKAKTTFEDFLKGKSKAFQDDVLGKGKATLYRERKITLRQLLDQSGNPLTLAELELKYA